MRALYAARLEDLAAGDFIKALCVDCGHLGRIPHDAAYLATLPGYTRVLGLTLRCSQCGSKRIDVSMEWHDAVPQRL
jgi:hypothetical protein